MEYPLFVYWDRFTSDITLCINTSSGGDPITVSIDWDRFYDMLTSDIMEVYSFDMNLVDSVIFFFQPI
jgi:hypothetical protein